MEVSAYVLHTPRLLVGQSASVSCQSHVLHGKRCGEGISRGFATLASTTVAAFSAVAFSRSVPRGRDRQLIERHCRTTNLETKLRETESKLRAALSTPRAEKELADLRERLREATDELHKERDLNQNFEGFKEELANARARLTLLADPDKAVTALEIKLKDADKKLRTALLAPRAEKQVLDLKEQLKQARAQLASGGGSQTIVDEQTTGGPMRAAHARQSQIILDLQAELKDAKAQMVAQEALQQQLDQSEQQKVLAQRNLETVLQAQMVAQEALQQQLDQSEQQLVELQAKLEAADAKPAESAITAADAKPAESAITAETAARTGGELEAAQAAAAEFESALKDLRVKAGENLVSLQKSQAEGSKLRLEVGLVADARNRLLLKSKALQNKLEQSEQRASAAELRLEALES